MGRSSTLPKIANSRKNLPSETSTSSNWDKFLGEKYEGGKKRVPNPNPKTKDKYKQVSTDTALKFEQGGKFPFFDRLKKEFQAWMSSFKKDESKTKSKSPKVFDFRQSEDRFDQRKIKVKYDNLEILYGEGIPWAEEKFGSDLKQMSHNISKVSGVSALSNVTSEIFSLGEKLLCHTKGEHIFNMARDISRREDGTIVLHNTVLKLKPDAPKGLGTRIFANQIIEAKRMGVDRIECLAHRDDDEDPPFIGYKVWPKMGYDGLIPEEVLNKSPQIMAALTKNYDLSQGKKFFVSDLLAIKGGWELWDKYGDSFDAIFDLNNTRQLGILQDYLERKAKSEKKSVDEYLKMGSLRIRL